MSTLSIDQLLRAAQILEHNATLQQLIRQQQQQQQQQQQLQQKEQQQLQSAFFQLGEDYQNKLIMPKMRAVHVEPATAGGSAGSSRRSTPSGGMFSNCGSTPNLSSPNSPPTTLLLANGNIATAAAVANSNSAYVHVQPSLALHNAAAVVQHDAELLRQLEIPATTTTISCEQQQQLQQRQLQLQQQQQHSPSSVQLGDFTAGCSTATASSTAVVVPSFAPTQMRNSPSSSSIASMNVRQNRAAHNELEKNRRANLRGYLDSLKSVLPADVDATRDTTLSLLTRARNHLRGMKKEKDALIEKRAKAMAEMMQLRQELANIGAAASAESQKQQQSPVQHEQQLQTIEQQEQQMTVFASTSSAQCINTASVVAAAAAAAAAAMPVSTAPVSGFVLPALPASALDVWWTTSQQQQEQKRQPDQLQQQQQQKQQYDRAAVKKAIDLYMEGLLPALPLLYPYNQLLARHGTSTANVNAAQRC